MAHERHHHHHHSPAGVAEAGPLRRVYLICIGLNLAFLLAEAGIGVWKHSLGLLSDAGHNLSDVFSLILALIGFRMARSGGNKRFTYGYRKGSVLISLLNAVILLVAVGAILAESIRKLRNPVALDGGAVAWTAGAGIIVNGLTAWLLMRHQKNDINTRGAFLHMAADTLVSAGVVVSGIIISLTGWYFIDPVIGITVAGVILFSTWELLSESVRMSIDAVPEQIDFDETEKLIESVPGVCGAHHIHIWPISTTETALTAHLAVSSDCRPEEVVKAVKQALREAGISHATLETEREGSICGDDHCC